MNRSKVFICTLASFLACSSNTVLAMETAAPGPEAGKSGCNWAACFRTTKDAAATMTPMVIEFGAGFLANTTMAQGMRDTLAKLQKEHPEAFEIVVNLSKNKEVEESAKAAVAPLLQSWGIMDLDGNLTPIFSALVNALIVVAAPKRGVGSPTVRIMSLDEAYEQQTVWAPDDKKVVGGL